MSWTELFPVMGEDLVDEYDQLATPEERAELNEWYGVKEVFNSQNKRHLVSLSLFWKPNCVGKSVYPTPTREILQKADESGLDLDSAPWTQHIQPVLDAMPALLEKHNDVTVRIYLAADLDFLVNDLVNVGCEIYLMRHPSLAQAPGLSWRVLAFTEKNRLITTVNSDRLGDVAENIERTRAMDSAGLKCWRIPIVGDTDADGDVVYKSFIGGYMGGEGGWPMERLLHAFTWHVRRGTIPAVVDVPGCGVRPLNRGYWPDLGFEEWFLTVVMYPRMAGAGILTFVPTGAYSILLLFDVEYVTWANPNSQLVVFPGESCCAPPQSSKETNHEEEKDAEVSDMKGMDTDSNKQKKSPAVAGANKTSNR
jgi:hypothetical protein